MNTAQHDGPPQPADNAADESIRATARQVFEELSTSQDVACFIAAALVLSGRGDDGNTNSLYVFQHADGRVFISVATENGVAIGAASTFAESCAEVLEDLDEQHAASLSDEASS